MIELLIGSAAGVALTLAFQRFTKGAPAHSGFLEEMKMAVDQAFADLAVQIEALPAKLTAGVQAQLEAANAQVSSLQQNASDNLAAVQASVAKITPPAA